MSDMVLPEPLWQPRASLAASITRAASLQTYFTIRFLVDRALVADAFRAYAYFRWVDNTLDGSCMEHDERCAFVRRQCALVEACYGTARVPPPSTLDPEEIMLVELVRAHERKPDGLQCYICNMLAVMAFDASRRGQCISRRELAAYTGWLATAVTEALHHFIGHGQSAPHDETRYLAVSGAHIAHMLRDAVCDAEAGYFNIPCEVLAERAIDPRDTRSEAYRAWVKERVDLARRYFHAGERYLARVENLRCRLAGYSYIARFLPVLDAIERDGYMLRPDYGDCRSLRESLRLGGAACVAALSPQRSRAAPFRTVPD